MRWLLAIALAGAAQLALPGPASSQGEARRLPVVGWLRVANPERPTGRPLREALARIGIVDGRDYRLEVKDAGGRVERVPELARELVAEGAAIIVAFGPDATRAALAATTGTPVVSASALIEEGFVSGLAKPGGNLTGVSMFISELASKQLEVLKELMPSVRRAGVLNDSSTRIPDRPRMMAEAAQRLGVELVTRDVKAPEEFDGALAAIRAAGATALVVNASTLFASMRDDIGALSQRHGLPALCQWREMVAVGCLASYGFPLAELFELIAEQVAKVLKGAKPESLPIMQPRRFELTVNQAVARRLGLAIPPAILLRADEVLE